MFCGLIKLKILTVWQNDQHIVHRKKGKAFNPKNTNPCCEALCEEAGLPENIKPKHYLKILHLVTAVSTNRTIISICPKTKLIKKCLCMEAHKPPLNVCCRELSVGKLTYVSQSSTF